MKKINKFVKKHDVLFIIIIAIIILAGSSLNRTIEVTDELWNFNNIYKMYNGAVIYNDSNVIQTPLFFYIGFIFFMIFGANFFVFRIYNIIIFTILITLIYLLFKTLKISKIKSCLYTILASILFVKLLPAGANYNVVAFTFIIFGIILIIKNNSKPIKLYNILQGIIIFSVFMSKQNIGIFYMLGLILSEFLTNESKKSAIVKLIKEFSVSGILLLGFLTYLYFNNNLYGFINYAFLGITEFANENFKYEITATIGFIITVFSSFLIYFILKKLAKGRVEKLVLKNIDILFCFSITMMFTVFPIFNKYHILLALGISLIEIIYIFHEILIKEILEDNSKIIKRSYSYKHSYRNILFII